jgi:hypothetical protein
MKSGCAGVGHDDLRFKSYRAIASSKKSVAVAQAAEAARCRRPAPAISSSVSIESIGHLTWHALVVTDNSRFSVATGESAGSMIRGRICHTKRIRVRKQSE